ncbi:MAG: Gldg family protein [Pirellulales bacterium]|nr:Gldg family protein [Pirellulales bacterium]
MNGKVLTAVFKRNFVSYFSNPTGYVFMCLFVALSSAAAFWPEEFFKANLANLNQLNDYFAFIMLVFIPAITMATWAEERQQGTDELLLTIPANDFDVVIGKYLATLAIYSVSLLFSFVSNTIILNWLGEPDIGLIMCNYAGYFFVGMAMLAVGLVGSFITSNLTLAFVAGFLLNAPLVLIGGTRGIFGIEIDSGLASWSIPYHLDDFGRGVFSLSSVTYFLAIVAIALYLSMVLIERRHWAGGRDEGSKLGHFVVRSLALIAIAWCCISITTNHDVVRWDWTSDRLNSISPDTVKLISNLDVEERKELDEEIGKIDAKLEEMKGKDDADEKKKRELERERRKLERELKHLDRQVKIEAFIAPKVPERYVQQRLRVLARLNELKQLNPDKLEVVVRNTKLYSEWAEKAKNNYDITAQRRQTTQFDSEQFFMGAAITAGRDRVVIPFFEIGTSPEYEIVRAITTVGRPQRKVLGVVTTDAAMMGDVSLQAIMSGGSRPRPIIEELREQYKIVEVDPKQKIVDPEDAKSLEKYDVLLVVQPSSMPQAAMDNVLAAIEAGVPTAIFEDPFPVWVDGVPGTDQPRRPRQGMMGRSQPPEPKGNFDAFLSSLGIRMAKITPNRLPERLRKLQEGKDYEDPADMFARLDKDKDGKVTAREFMSDESITEKSAPYDYRAFSTMDRNGDGILTKSEFNDALETAIVWENFNPYPKLKRIPFISKSWVFANSNAPGAYKKSTIAKDVTIEEAFSSKDRITDGMNEVLFLYPGAIKPRKGSDLKFHPLVATGDRTGAIRVDDITDPAMRGPRDKDGQAEFERRADERFVLAARIQGKSNKTKKADMDVVFVADVDPLSNAFLDMREQQVLGLDLMFQDVAFVLNIIDSLAGDDRFLNLRKNEVKFRKLTTVEDRKEESRKRTDEEEDKYRTEFRMKIEDLERERDQIQAKIDEVQDEFENASDISERKKLLAKRTALRMTFDDAQKQFQYDRIQEQRKRDEAIEKMQDELKTEIESLEDHYKWLAVVLPPIPPLLVAIGVYFTRRAREKEGVSKNRLR